MNKLKICLMLLLVCLVSGCAHVDVSHLKSQPWKLETRRTLDMEFMSFDYEVIPRKEGYGVRGMAYIKKNSVPVWAGWVDDLLIQGYISDDDGVAFTQGEQVFSPRKLEDDKGIPFDFELNPESSFVDTMSISFGYRLTLSKAKGDMSRPPFMAIERAVSQ